MTDPSLRDDIAKAIEDLARESEETQKAMVEASATKPCPMCGNDGWNVLYPGSVMLIGTADGPRHLASYTLFCSNCGFVRQHAKELVRRAAPEDAP